MLAVSVFLATLTGCGSSSQSDEEHDWIKVKPNEPMSDDCSWINSMLDGAVDKTTDISEKDDFYTAVNLDWDLKTTLAEDQLEVNVFTETGDEIEKRKFHIIDGTEDPEMTDNAVGIDEEDLRHDEELIRRESPISVI